MNLLHCCQQQEEALPINDKQREAIRVVCELNKSAACGHHLRYQHEVQPTQQQHRGVCVDADACWLLSQVSEFLAYEFQKWLDRDLNEL